MRIKKIFIAVCILLITTSVWAVEVGVPTDMAPNALGTRNQTWASMAWSEESRCWLVVWREGYLNEKVSDIWCARISEDGSSMDPAGICVSKGVAGVQDRPRVASNGKDFLVIWEDYRNGNDWDIYAARVSGAGEILDQEAALFAGGAHNQCRPDVAFVPSVNSEQGKYCVLWMSFVDGKYGIYGTSLAFTNTPVASNVQEVLVLDCELDLNIEEGVLPVLSANSNGDLLSASFVAAGRSFARRYLTTHVIDAQTGGRVGDLRPKPNLSNLDTGVVPGKLGWYRERSAGIAFGTNEAVTVTCGDTRVRSTKDLSIYRFSKTGDLLGMQELGSTLTIESDFKPLMPRPTVTFMANSYMVISDCLTLIGTNTRDPEYRIRLIGWRVFPNGSVDDENGFVVAGDDGFGCLLPSVAVGPAGVSLVVYSEVRGADDVKVVGRIITCNEIPFYTINASVDGLGGSITPDGSVSVVENHLQEFVVLPDTGYDIEDVVVDGTSIGVMSNYFFSNVTNDHEITATFTLSPTSPPPISCTLSIDVVGDGFVELNPTGGVYNAGTVVSLNALANIGNALSAWSGDLTGATNPVEVTIATNMTVTATFTALPNLPPVAVDDLAGTIEDIGVVVAVLANDSDLYGDLLTVVSVSQPANGVVSNDAVSVTYTPNKDFTGVDTFTYTISDGELTDTATVTMTVSAPYGGPDFICTIRATGGDYSSLSAWEAAMESDLTLSSSMIFGIANFGTYDSAVDDGGSITFTGGGTGTIKHVVSAAGKAYIVGCSGVIQPGSVTCDVSGHTFSVADAGQQIGLVEAECYNDWPATGLDDYVRVDGWVTDADHYVRIYTPESERHTGKLKDGLNYTGFTIAPTVSTVYAINVYADYTRIEGIAVDVISPTRGYGIQVVATGYVIDSCLVNGAKDTGSAGHAYVAYVNTGDIAYIRNCIAQNSRNGFYLGFRSFVYAYNCTAVNSTQYGFRIREGSSGNNVIFRNCLSDNVGTGGIDFSKDEETGGPVLMEHCASSDATVESWGGTNNRSVQTFTYVDKLNSDFHLAASDVGAQGYGMDLSGDLNCAITTDIDGETRSGTWDIGADEVSGGALDPDTDGDGTPDSTDKDDDGDGMPDAWEIAHGFNPLVNEDTEADLDNDGMSNLDESICGTDPYDENSKLETGNLTMDGTGINLTFDTVLGRLYDVECIDDLSGTNWVNVTTNIQGTGEAVNVNDPTALARRFYRIRVRLEG